VQIVLGRWPYWVALLNTLIIGLGATAIASAVGVPLAWLFARTNLPGKGFLEKLATIPIFIPPFVGAIAWILLAAPRIGAFNFPFRTRPIVLGRTRYVAAGFVWLYCFFTIIAPILVLIAAAFSTFTWSGRFTWVNFQYLWSSEDVRVTLQNSLLISLIAATVATVIGIVISWTTQRTKIPNRQILEYLAVLPVAVPGIAFGVGVALFWLRMPIPVYGTIWIIVLAFIGRFSGYAVRSISSSIVQVHPELEESARIAGYGWVRTFARITLPLIRPSIVASWMLLFSIFITELSMVILLYTAETRTFSVLSFEVWNVGNFSQVASLSLLQLVIGVAVLQTVQLLWPQRNVHG
jgi:iron(III) transport system permease protein